jgi:hypothetical protein
VNQVKRLPQLNNPLIASRKESTSIAVFWYGVAIFAVANIILQTNNEILNGAACQGIQLASLILMIAGAAGAMRFKFDDKYLETVFIIFMLYQVTVVVRGIKFEYNYLKNVLLDPSFGILPYLTPLAILLPRKLDNLKKPFIILAIFGVLFFIFDAVYIDVLMNPDWFDPVSLQYVEIFVGTLAFPMTFLLITFAFQKKAINIFTIVVALAAIYFLLYRARRGSLFLIGLMLIASALVYLIYTKRTALVIFISSVSALLGTVFLSGMKLPGILTFLMARKDEDTRSGVEQWMYSSMTPRFWIFGKGMDGKYYCPTVINLADNSYDRPIIETGYLQIILKGGIVTLVLMGLIIIPAVYKGLFQSKNILTKGAAMFLIVWMVSLYPTVGNGFSMNYLLVWVSAGLCYSKQIRDTPDMAIKAAFKRLK